MHGNGGTSNLGVLRKSSEGATYLSGERRAHREMLAPLTGNAKYVPG